MIKTKFWERTEGEAHIPHPLMVEYPGNRFRERRWLQPEPVVIHPTPFDLPSNYYKCVHVETVINQAEGEVDYVRCQKDSVVGFLCAEHDHKVLARKVKGLNTPFYMLKETTGENVLVVEQEALSGVERERCGLPKAKFGFDCIKDYTLSDMLDHMLTQILLDDYEFGIVADEDEIPF